MTFSGSVTIKGKKVGRPSERITLHQKGLKVISATITRHDKKGNQTFEVERINLQKSYDEVRLHAKDLGICHDMAARFGVALPVVERMLAEYAELMARGYGDEDISATYRLKAELFERTNIMSAPSRGKA